MGREAGSGHTWHAPYQDWAPLTSPLQETGDHLLAFTYVITAVCNGILVGQLLYYWNIPLDRKKKE